MYIKFIKRLLDIFTALLSGILLSPFMALIACLIKIFDPGPVIFSHQRVGRLGHNFKFYKFRSMPVSTGDIPSDKLGDIQLTWIGAFVRRTNIDELPQLFNILKGDMSIVGPRPPLPNQLELLSAREINGALACRPGLTGLAQINSFDGMTIHRKADFDGAYALKISFLNDIDIIFRTLFYLLKKPPVY